MARRIEVTIKIGDREVTLRGPEDFVQQEVERLAQLPSREPIAPESTERAVPAEAPGPKLPSFIERDFVAEKQPHGHIETVAVLAYVLTQNGQAEFTDEDIRRAYLRAGVRPPKVVSQALRDAKNVSDYIERGSKPGTFRLSPHGERTVIFDLPRSKDKQTAQGGSK